MHNDATTPIDLDAWPGYFASLRTAGCFQGGSPIGGGACVRKSGLAAKVSDHLGGYIRIDADSLDHARTFIAGNPVFEAGGTIEIRGLPRTG